MSTSRANWGKARDRASWSEGADWTQRLQENPQALFRIVADSYAFAVRERDPSIVKPGRRVPTDPVSIEEVFGTIFEDHFSTAPFPEALAELIGSDSQRAFSAKVPCHQTTISRLLDGKMTPDLAIMERLAVAGGRRPWFFAEWRAMFISKIVRESMLVDPRMSIGVLKGLRELDRRGSGNGR